MLDQILKHVTEGVSNASFGKFVRYFTPNQELPSENVLVSKFSYGNSSITTLNNVVRIAEVSDGLIVKLPLFGTVKAPFEMIKTLNVNDRGRNSVITIRFHKDDLEDTHITIPAEMKGQLPMLLSRQGAVNMPTMPTPIESNMPNELDRSEKDLWSIPKTKTPVRKNPPLDVSKFEIGKVIRAVVLIWALYQLITYLYFNYGF